jgi:hypothetical protein
MPQAPARLPEKHEHFPGDIARSRMFQTMGRGLMLEAQKILDQIFRTMKSRRICRMSIGSRLKAAAHTP